MHLYAQADLLESSYLQNRVDWYNGATISDMSEVGCYEVRSHDPSLSIP